MNSIFLLPLLFIWLALSAAGGYSVYVLTDKIFLNHYEEYRFLYYGFGAYIVSIIFIPPKRYAFWNVLTHELIHSIFAVLTLSKPQQLFVDTGPYDNDGGGYMTCTYNPGIIGFIRSHMVSLAPYFFPIFAIALGGLYFMVRPDSPGYIKGSFFVTTKCKIMFFLIGFAYSYHIIIALKDSRPIQTDFDANGYVYGLAFVIFMQILFLIVILSFITPEYHGYKIILDYFEFLKQEICKFMDIGYLKQQFNNLMDTIFHKKQTDIQHLSHTGRH